MIHCSILQHKQQPVHLPNIYRYDLNCNELKKTKLASKITKITFNSGNGNMSFFAQEMKTTGRLVVICQLWKLTETNKKTLYRSGGFSLFSYLDGPNDHWHLFLVLRVGCAVSYSKIVTFLTILNFLFFLLPIYRYSWTQTNSSFSLMQSFSQSFCYNYFELCCIYVT